MDNFDYILLYPLAYVAFCMLSHIIFYLRLLSPILGLGPFISPMIYASIFSICLGALSTHYEALQKHELAQADPSIVKAGDAALSSSTLSSPEAFVTALAKCLIAIFVAPLDPGEDFLPSTRYDDVLPAVGLAEDVRAPASSGEGLTIEIPCEGVLPSVQEPTPVLVHDDVQDIPKDMSSQSQEVRDALPQYQEDPKPYIYQSLSPRFHDESPLQTYEHALSPPRQVASELDSLKESGNQLLSAIPEDTELAELVELGYSNPVESDRDVLPRTFEDTSLSVEEDVAGKNALELHAVPAFFWDQVPEAEEYEDDPPSPERRPAPFEQDAGLAHGDDLPSPQDDARFEHLLPPPPWYIQAVQTLVLNESASDRHHIDAILDATDNEGLPALDADAESSGDDEDEVSEPPRGEIWELYRGGNGPYYIDDGPTEEEMRAAYNSPRPWWSPLLGYAGHEPRPMDWEPVPREQCIQKSWGPPVVPNVQIREVKMLDLSKRLKRLDLGPQMNEVQMLDVMDVLDDPDMIEM